MWNFFILINAKIDILQIQIIPTIFGFWNAIFRMFPDTKSQSFSSRVRKINQIE